jgi:DNA polymerase alpha subunit B
MCKLFNLPPKELYFKWEAMNFNARTRDSSLHTFTMDSAVQLKQSLQRELQAEATKAKIAQGRASLSGKMSRGRGAGLLNIGKRAVPGVAVKSEHGAGTGQPKAGGTAAVAGPSKVRYVGPAMDDSSRKKRACEYSEHSTGNGLNRSLVDRYMYEKVLDRGSGRPRFLMIS